MNHDLVNLIVFLFFQSDDTIGNVVGAAFEGSILLLLSNFVFLENGKELFVINSSFAALPEGVNERLQTLGLDSQIQVFEDVFEVLTRDDTVATFVYHFK